MSYVLIDPDERKDLRSAEAPRAARRAALEALVPAAAGTAPLVWQLEPSDEDRRSWRRWAPRGAGREQNVIADRSWEMGW